MDALPKLVAVFCLAAVGAGIAASAEEPSRPRMSAIRQLEKTLKMPEGAGKLEEYDRYYSSDIVEGEPTLVGTFHSVHLFGEHHRRGRIFIVRPDEVLFVNDGGCFVVYVYASEDGTRLRHGPTCNGKA